MFLIPTRRCRARLISSLSSGLKTPQRGPGWSSKPSRHGKICSKVKRGKKADADKFDMYVDHQETARSIPVSPAAPPCCEAPLKGILRVSLQLDESRALTQLQRRLVHNRQFEFYRELIVTN